jgi:activator of HSP90 ATPase
MKTKTLTQTVTFDASPEEVYKLIMDSKKHSSFSGAKAKMSQKVGGKFETYDGYCHGVNVELKEGKKIVQDWHFTEDGWPEDHFSRVSFKFEKAKNKTKMTFTQSGIPAHKYASLKSGWIDYYWEPMKEYLSNKK